MFAKMDKFQKIYLTNSIITGTLFNIKTICNDSKKNQDSFISGKFIIKTAVTSGIVGFFHPITIPYSIKQIYDLKTKVQYIGRGEFKYLSWNEIFERL